MQKTGLATLTTGDGEQPEVEVEDNQVLGTFTVTVHSFIKLWIGTVTVDKSIQVLPN